MIWVLRILLVWVLFALATSCEKRQGDASLGENVDLAREWAVGGAKRVRLAGRDPQKEIVLFEPGEVDRFL